MPQFPVRRKPTISVPALLASQPDASKHFIEFFAAKIRNKHTRRAYVRAVTQFFDWCFAGGLRSIEDVEPVHVATYIEIIAKTHSKPTAKQALSAIRHLFDWLVVSNVLALNPARVVRGPTQSIKRGKTRVLSPDQVRELLAAIDTETLIGLRDRALIALMAFTFARVGGAVSMNVGDYFTEGRVHKVRLQEKGSKEHVVPAHHQLVEYLDAYLGAARTAVDENRPLFQTFNGRGDSVAGNRMTQPDVYRMVRRRALAAGVKGRIGCHSWRATGITTFLLNGGQLERAQTIANHSSIRTTGLYDRRDDQPTLDEIERIRF